jgi:ABC-2 type transport system ATP-binding protein
MQTELISQMQTALVPQCRIEVENLRKVYDRFLAVDGVSFSLSAGSVCGFVGPNGAGKTTTMRCLAGLIPATQGRITIDGRPVSTTDAEVKRRVVYVPDDPPLFDDLSVLDHFRMIARLYRIEDARLKTQQLLEDFELTHKIHSAGSALSRGMRQKLAIGCAVLANPDALLLDEPLTGLDPSGIRHLLSGIQKWADQGKTILISSHLLAMIQDVCTHVMVARAGKVRFFGTKAELCERYPAASTLEDAYFEATC